MKVAPRMWRFGRLTITIWLRGVWGLFSYKEAWELRLGRLEMQWRRR